MMEKIIIISRSLSFFIFFSHLMVGSGGGGVVFCCCCLLHIFFASTFSVILYILFSNIQRNHAGVFIHVRTHTPIHTHIYMYTVRRLKDEVTSSIALFLLAPLSFSIPESVQQVKKPRRKELHRIIPYSLTPHWWSNHFEGRMNKRREWPWYFIHTTAVYNATQPPAPLYHCNIQYIYIYRYLSGRGAAAIYSGRTTSVSRRWRDNSHQAGS